ncbi:hypothetical protein Tco_1148285 [Tanacetum coccineum]
MNGWLEEDDDMNEDVEIEVDDDAELIFPYEVEGDQTLPLRDESSNSEPPNAESSDSVSSDSESEDEEIKVAPEVDVAPERFYLDMVRIGAVPKPPSDEEDTERLRKKSKNSTSDRTEGPSEPCGPPSDS